MNSPASPAAPSAAPVRVGLIGCGQMGLQHLRAIRTLKSATIVGVADPAADPAALAGLLPAGARVVATTEELLTAVRPDVVHIVTPPATHAALALEAVRAGCHVYVEKPFTPTRAEAEAIMAAAAAHGRLVCAGHQVLFEPPALAVIDELNAIGRLVHVESYFSFRTARRTITPVEQAKDILPHAVYPLIAQLRAGTGSDAPIAIRGCSARASGDLYAVLQLGSATGLVLVTLNGRPVEQYQQIVSTNGSFRADYVTGNVVRLTGPGAGLGVLFTPYRRAWQTFSGATRGFARLVFGRKTSYPGLVAILERFYSAIVRGSAGPLTPQSILDTVDLCEQLGAALDQAERDAEAEARHQLAEAAKRLPARSTDHPLVLLTGGTGLLGTTVAGELRHAGFGVRVLARRVPRFSARAAGVEYVVADLAQPLDPAVLNGVGFIVHCAAATAGGETEHRRNSLDATRHVFEAAAAAGIRRGIHVSSLAVLKPGHEVRGILDEDTPLDAGHLRRGPYVWGKAESELLVRQLAAERNLDIRIIRPGPLVDYSAFQPPGRLGREVGPLFVAIGGRRAPLSVCDVSTAARVIRSYAEDFAAAPPLLNLVEAPPPTRRELAMRLHTLRPDLSFLWFPAWLLWLLSGPLKLLQRLALGSKAPVDVYAAFASERYRTDLAAQVIARAGPSSSAERADATQTGSTAARRLG
ncbi:MAG: NAD-dependent epimerase/dehydratase family protein [Gammaproteobacteria bacterium]|nr:NAD-dependent epimerase/dehydratase family protein [Gammaproteobacteria bacterium]